MAAFSNFPKRVQSFLSDSRISTYLNLCTMAAFALFCTSIMMIEEEQELITRFQDMIISIFELIRNFIFRITPNAEDVFGRILSVDNLPSLFFLSALSYLFKAFVQMLRILNMGTTKPVVYAQATSKLSKVPSIDLIPTINKINK